MSVSRETAADGNTGTLVKGVADGSRTRDRRDHNAELYQLSYSHLAGLNLPGRPI